MINLIQGVIIGVANVIPGVSGGTLALIMGIYERLMEAIGEFFVADKKQKLIYGFFLSKILIGAVIGILLFAKTIEFLYSNYFQPTNFFFIGLIIASIPGITRGEEGIIDKKRNIVLFLLGFCLIFALSSMHSGEKGSIGALVLDITPLYSVKLLLCGALASAAMIIPGISGSMLLMVLGEYYNVLGLINSRNLVGIAIVGLGAVVGILLFSKVIDFLLKNHRGMTIYFIVGLIVASLVEIWPGIDLDMFSIMVNLASFVSGVFLVLIMFRMEKRGKKIV